MPITRAAHTSPSALAGRHAEETARSASPDPSELDVRMKLPELPEYVSFTNAPKFDDAMVSGILSDKARPLASHSVPGSPAPASFISETVPSSAGSKARGGLRVGTKRKTAPPDFSAVSRHQVALINVQQRRTSVVSVTLSSWLEWPCPKLTLSFTSLCHSTCLSGQQARPARTQVPVPLILHVSAYYTTS